MANVKGTVQTAAPIVKKLAKDEDFRKTLISAYMAARNLYDEIGEDKKVKALAAKIATDPKLQKELAKQFKEVQKTAKKAAKPSHKKRNALIMAGIVVGLLYNPKTGPQTRKWLREKMGGGDTFEYTVDNGGPQESASSDQPASSGS